MERAEKDVLRLLLARTNLEEGIVVPVSEEEGSLPAQKPCPPDAKLISLPEPGILPDKNVNFLEIIELRTTVRQYTQECLTMEELSYLLWCTQGVKMVLPDGNSRRTVPSAGGRHAFETYLYIQKVEGLPPGLYRFLAFEHALVFEAPLAGIEGEFLAGFRASGMVRESAVTFLWVAISGRMTRVFGPRAFRYIFLDAGHVCENLYLAGQTIHVGTCAIGAFYDEKLHAALKLEGEREFVVYGATVGKI